jgi:hypothetical protein
MLAYLKAECLILTVWVTQGAQPPQWFYDEVVTVGIGSNAMELFEEWAADRGLLFPNVETTESYVTNEPASVYDIVAGRYRGQPVVDDPVFGGGGNKK